MKDVDWQKIKTRQTGERASMYRTLCTFRVLIGQEKGWGEPSFGGVLMKQDCTRLVLRLARWPFPM